MDHRFKSSKRKHREKLSDVGLGERFLDTKSIIHKKKNQLIGFNQNLKLSLWERPCEKSRWKDKLQTGRNIFKLLIWQRTCM